MVDAGAGADSVCHPEFEMLRETYSEDGLWSNSKSDANVASFGPTLAGH